MKIPKSLKIGPYCYGVVFKEDLEHEGNSLFGLCDQVNHIIYMRKGMEPKKKMETFLHECLHAIEDVYGVEIGEEKVSLLGLSLMAIINENKIRF
jgi:hypothetical protein